MFIFQEHLQNYKNYLDHLKEKMLKEKSELHETAERVRQKALEELKMKIKSADKELKSQIEYRESLTNQIMANHTYLVYFLNLISN